MSRTAKQTRPFLAGNWSDNLSWEFYLSEDLPYLSGCTAVYCLAIVKETDKVRLTRIDRGWEMLGGHIKSGESLEDTLIRECLEEGGFLPEATAPYGYIKVTAKQPELNRQGGFYPQIAYLPHFIAVTNSPLGQPTGEEVHEAGSFYLSEIAALSSAHETVIRAGMKHYLAIKAELVARLPSV